MNRPPHRQRRTCPSCRSRFSAGTAPVRHGRGNEPGKRRRIVTIGAAIIAVAAIAIGIIVYNRVVGAYRPAARPPTASIRFLPRCVYQGTSRLV